MVNFNTSQIYLANIYFVMAVFEKLVTLFLYFSFEVISALAVYFLSSVNNGPLFNFLSFK